MSRICWYTTLCASLSILVVGCASRQPDNRQWHTVSCSTFKQINFCQAEALAICPNGYDIYNPRWMEGEQRRYMEIACK
ncbi:MAG TPA: hypothetical protein VEA39_01720 [Methylophilaceae bacterium]|nr:hypothetical protein [Methylophilaceae bacterium]